MKIISANVNGIRAAERKGFFQWLKKIDADIICIQETKAQEEQLDPEDFYPAEYHCYYFDAQKKGYSGVAIYSKLEPEKITRGWTGSADNNESRLSGAGPWMASQRESTPPEVPGRVQGFTP